jgi:hypothetical protein
MMILRKYNRKYLNSGHFKIFNSFSLLNHNLVLNSAIEDVIYSWAEFVQNAATDILANLSDFIGIYGDTDFNLFSSHRLKISERKFGICFVRITKLLLFTFIITNVIFSKNLTNLIQGFDEADCESS